MKLKKRNQTASSLLQYIYKYIILSVNCFSYIFFLVNHLFSFSSATYIYETYLTGLPLAKHIPLTYNFSSMHIDQLSTIPTQIHLPLVQTRQQVLPPHYHQPTSRPNPAGITTKTPLPIPSGCRFYHPTTDCIALYSNKC